MNHEKIDGLLLREMLIAGAALLEKNREAVDALNVFPVPDGDTGTNMNLTIHAAVKEISAKEYLRADEASAAAAKGALRGARGNSGVILSQLLRGFSRGIDGCAQIGPEQFAAALKSGADTAYKAVMKPKEGTILTVARVIAETTQRTAPETADMEALFAVILESGEAILRKTPDMLPVLKQAGVVDAGGRGLMLLYSGMLSALRGEEVPSIEAEAPHADSETFVDDHDSIDELKLIYCTEYTIQNLHPTVTDGDLILLRRKLNRIGDRVHVAGDLNLVQVHVHTNDPGKALQNGLALGELTNLKVENMLEVRRERERAEAAAKPKEHYGIVSVSLGDGFAEIFRSLGVSRIVDGGQTMNPSIDDLRSAIEEAKADTVFVFPNNSNVILAAEQAATLCSCSVRVIPTKNVAMGIAGVIAFQADETPDANTAAMTKAAEHVKSGMITEAIRDSHYESLDIHAGDYIGLSNGKISVCDHDPLSVARRLMEQLVTDEDTLITIYYGADATEEDAASLADEFSARYSDCDIEMQSGGQPVYSYILAVE